MSSNLIILIDFWVFLTNRMRDKRWFMQAIINKFLAERSKQDDDVVVWYDGEKLHISNHFE